MLVMNDDDVGKIWKCHVRGRIGNLGETGSEEVQRLPMPRRPGRGVSIPEANLGPKIFKGSTLLSYFRKLKYVL